MSTTPELQPPCDPQNRRPSTEDWAPLNPADDLSAGFTKPCHIDTDRYLLSEPPSERVSPLALQGAQAASLGRSSSSDATTPTAAKQQQQQQPGQQHAPQQQRLSSVLLRNVYVAGLPIGFTDVHLAELLGQFGRLISCRMFNGSRKVECMGRSYGFGLFEQREDAEAAVKGLASLVIEGRAIEIRLSDAQVVKKTKATRKAAKGLEGQSAATAAHHATTTTTTTQQANVAFEQRRGAPIFVANPPPPPYAAATSAVVRQPPPYRQQQLQAGALMTVAGTAPPAPPHLHATYFHQFPPSQPTAVTASVPPPLALPASAFATNYHHHQPVYPSICTAASIVPAGPQGWYAAAPPSAAWAHQPQPAASYLPEIPTVAAVSYHPSYYASHHHHM